MDIEGDRKLIIQQILNWGTPKAVKWLFKTYGRREIKNVLVDPARGVWDKRSLNFWSKILDVHIPRARYKKAILNIIPSQIKTI